MTKLCKEKEQFKKYATAQILLYHLSLLKYFNECFYEKPYELGVEECIVISILLMRKLTNRSYTTCSKSPRKSLDEPIMEPSCFNPQTYI